MEAAAQMRRFTQGIGEMEAYLSYNKDILLSESGNDLFKRLFDAAKVSSSTLYLLQNVL